MTWHCTSSEKAGAIVAPVMRALSTARVVAAGAPLGGRIGEVVTGDCSVVGTPMRMVKSTATPLPTDTSSGPGAPSMMRWTRWPT